jgi:Bacterial Ig-like domain (group 3)/Domain of unknown function DUF11
MKNNKNSTNLFKLSLFLLGMGIIFSFGINATSAAHAASAPISSNIYVNGSSGNDSWDGLSSTYNSGLNGPKATIKNATGTITTNGTVYIASGTYYESNIQINTNMTIIGENHENTIIDGQKLRSLIFTIASGVNVTIANLTLTNTGKYHYGIITNLGTLNVENSTFSNFDVSKDGGAIYNGDSGILTIENSTFSDISANNCNGAAIYNAKGGIVTVENSTFQHDYADYNGGAIYNDGILAVENSTFDSNYGMTEGGAIYNNGELTVTNSTFYNNLDNGYGSAICNDKAGTSTVNFNRILGDSMSGIDYIYNNSGSINAEDNWWGTNFNGTNPQDAGITNFEVANWIVLTVKANPTNINIGDNSIITADLLHDNLGSLVDGTIPDGLAVNFSSDGLGTISPTTSTTTNGATNTLFTGNSSGISKVSTTVDDQTTTTNIKINSTSTATKITVKDVTGLNNQKVTLNATLTDINGNLLAGQKVFFSVNGHNYSAITNNNGIATINYIPNGVGNYNVTANYKGNDDYTGSEGTGFLMVNPSAYLYLQISSSNKNPKVGETFTITYKLGNNGPDNATNVSMTIPLPSNFTISNITGDGNWEYNNTTNSVTWTLSNVTVGDPYLYITGETNTNGVYVFGSNITSETYNLNTQEVTPITVTSNDPTDPTTPTTTNTIFNSNTKTIPMQHTGLPIAGLILAILTVLGGSVMSRRK